MVVENNYCRTDSTGYSSGITFITCKYAVGLKNIFINDNTRGAGYSSGFYGFNMPDQPHTFENLTFSNNLCEDRCLFGAMVLNYAENFSQTNSRIEIKNSKFENNTAPSASALFSEIQDLLLTNVTVKDNLTTIANGFIVVQNVGYGDSLNFAVTNGEYSENTIDQGIGGIYIHNTRLTVTTHVEIKGAVISGNNAAKGSAIYISEIVLSKDSFIHSTTFSNN